MYLTLVLSVLLVIGLAVLATYFARARRRAKQVSRQQAIAARLNAVVARAEQEHRERTAAASASAALTTVLPAIRHDEVPRNVA